MSGGLEEVAPERWDAVLRAAGLADAYYTRGFVAASALPAGGEPALLRLPGSDGDVFMAVLVRSDPTDVVAPYGYGGPAGTGAAPPLAEFPAAFQDWCERRGVISSFLVFHPLLGNADSPASAGWRKRALGGTVAWRLEGDLVAGMHRHHRRLYRRAHSAGLQAAATKRPSDLDEFVALYEATMRRADASEFYLFEPAYWEALRTDVPLVRVDVRNDRELLASVLGFGEPPWLHYHLGGTSDDGRRAGASQLALHGLAAWGMENGYELLHLGGGVGGRADSLLEFKLRFAPGGHIPSAIGKAVHDEAAYLRLANAAAVDWDGFFPAYRTPR